MLTLTLFFTILASFAMTDTPATTVNTSNPKLETATLGGGCFWCVEAVYQRIDGVKSVESGYSGGSVKDPTYEAVCSGTTGHAEVAQIVFDPAVLSYEKLLDVFWKAHDPTTLNRQGNDVGTQYRSVIFTHSEAQRIAAAKSKTAAQAHFKSPIVTEIVPLTTFYKAEDYHQKYFTNHKDAPYCKFVIQPKLDKLGLKY